MVAVAGRTGDGYSWRLAPCLVVLEDEVNARYPNRSTRSDGSIASAAHSRQNPTSDHEADRGDGYVKALDLTDDPPRFDPDDLAEQIRLRRDKRIKYVISDRRIFASYQTNHRPAWVWGAYTGSNPHESHVHFSVTDEGANDTSTWFPTSAHQEDDELALTEETKDWFRALADEIAGPKREVDTYGQKGQRRDVWRWAGECVTVLRDLKADEIAKAVVDALPEGADAKVIRQAVVDGIKETLGSLDDR